MTSANRKYKDSVFCKLFSDKERFLELYGAIEGKVFPKDTKIEETTLENVLFMERRNDLSFLVDDKLVVMLEHQSTINNNMPLRFLLYAAYIYENNHKQLELTVRVININEDMNSEIISRSRNLEGYSKLVSKTEKFRRQGESLDDAIKKALNIV